MFINERGTARRLGHTTCPSVTGSVSDQNNAVNRSLFNMIHRLAHRGNGPSKAFEWIFGLIVKGADEDSTPAFAILEDGPTLVLQPIKVQVGVAKESHPSHNTSSVIMA